MDNGDLREENLPDDLTPFITRTTLYHVSGGAFGDVWQCHYNANDISALVAVKAFRFPEHYDLERINRKISREIGILKILRHSNIVPLWGIATGFGRMSELRCLVSPWMPNGTLNAYLQAKHNDLTVLDRLRMLEDVSAGLRYLHSMSVTHGDITGANILIDEGGHARLIDFGLSTVVRPLLDQSHLVASSIRPGAIRYAAPELVLSDDFQDLPLEKTDIYSFGCIMLQVLSGRPPWSEIKSERLESCIPIMLFKNNTPQRPDGRPAIINLDWDFIQKCLQFGPELRPSADELLDFVTHRVFSSDSSRPPDGPPDGAQGGFPAPRLPLHHGSTLSFNSYSAGGSNRHHIAYLCRWDNEGTLCNHELQATPRDILAHMREHHHRHIRVDNNGSCRCLWVTSYGRCEKQLKIQSFGRHIMAHLGIRLQCSVCGTTMMARNDIAAKHRRQNASCSQADFLLIPCSNT